MGSIQSTQESDEEEEEAAARAAPGGGEDLHQDKPGQTGKKILEQEPEVLPCHPSASPLSPQLSSGGTPYLGPSVRVWDPYNVLAQTHCSLNQTFKSSLHHSDAFDPFEEDPLTEVYLIHHAESILNQKPDLTDGRYPSAPLTANGKRQTRALAVFLNSQGLRFDAVYSSPLERAKQTALCVCRELNIPEEKIQCSDGLMEMSQGQWEGCHRSDIYTPEMLNLIYRSQPDFCAPDGESPRQVEYRMVEFLNEKVVRRFEKLRDKDVSPSQSAIKAYDSHNSLMHICPSEGGDGSTVSQWELPNKQKHLARRKSGKSRLQFVTMGDTEIEYDPSNSNNHRQLQGQDKGLCDCMAIFTHGMAIKCLLTGLLGSNPLMIHRLCIDNSSMTVLRYSPKMGWQVQRINDTAHLRLL